MYSFRSAARALAAAGWMVGIAHAQVTPQVPIVGSRLPQFVDPLPELVTTAGTKETDAAGNLIQKVKISMCETRTSVLPTGAFVKGVAPPLTTVWAYFAGDCPAPAAEPRASYLGPVILASRGTPTEIEYVNALPLNPLPKDPLANPDGSGLTFWRYSVDQTLHWADPAGMGMNHCAMHGAHELLPPRSTNPWLPAPCAANYTGPIPAVPHLHGGEVPPELDGGPDAWFTSDGSAQGAGYYTKGLVGEVVGLPALYDAAGVRSASYPVGAIVRNVDMMGADPAGLYQVQTVGGTDGWVRYAARSATYTYPNTQEAAPIWFHDHSLGATRLNVYAGMAGAYLLGDPDPLTLPNGAPLPTLVPLVLQDRMFDIDGQLYFPAASSGGVQWALNQDHPYWQPEFLGDVVVVNGKAWPYKDVVQQRYTFLILNGSNARTYELSLVNPVTKAFGPPMWVIANDGGFLDAPVKIDSAAKQKLVVMPGERYEVVIDFSKVAAPSTWILKNTAKTPYPGGATPTGGMDKVLQFRVKPCGQGASCVASYDPAGGAPLRAPMDRLTNPLTGTPVVTPTVTRQLTLNEVMGMPMTMQDPVTGVTTAYPGGPLEVLVNNTKWGGTARPDFVPRGGAAGMPAYVSEEPVEGTTELWEIVNLTADAHPIHLHLVQFQLLNRQTFDLAKYLATYDVAFPANCPNKEPTGYCPAYGPPQDYRNNPQNPGVLGGNPPVLASLQGVPRPPAAQESGWKDTVLVPPGMVTRFLVRWAPTDGASTAFAFDPSGGGKYGYVWHCHIIDHEDNEMMRPDYVQAATGTTRTFVSATPTSLVADY